MFLLFFNLITEQELLERLRRRDKRQTSTEQWGYKGATGQSKPCEQAHTSIQCCHCTSADNHIGRSLIQLVYNELGFLAGVIVITISVRTKQHLGKLISGLVEFPHKALVLIMTAAKSSISASISDIFHAFAFGVRVVSIQKTINDTRCTPAITRYFPCDRVLHFRSTLANTVDGVAQFATNISTSRLTIFTDFFLTDDRGLHFLTSASNRFTKDLLYTSAEPRHKTILLIEQKTLQRFTDILTKPCCGLFPMSFDRRG